MPRTRPYCHLQLAGMCKIIDYTNREGCHPSIPACSTRACVTCCVSRGYATTPAQAASQTALFAASSLSHPHSCAPTMFHFRIVMRKNENRLNDRSVRVG